MKDRLKTLLPKSFGFGTKKIVPYLKHFVPKTNFNFYKNDLEYFLITENKKRDSLKIYKTKRKETEKIKENLETVSILERFRNGHRKM